MQKIYKHISPLFSLPVIASVLLLQACGSSETKPAAEKEAFSIPDTVMRTLRIDTVTTSQLVNSITLTGKVGSNEDNVVPVNALVTGNISDVKVALGDYVNAGQVLAVIRSSEMAGYGNDLINAESNLRLSETNLQKTKDLYKSGLASMTDSLNAEVAVQQAKSELNRVHQVLKING